MFGRVVSWLYGIFFGLFSRIGICYYLLTLCFVLSMIIDLFFVLFPCLFVFLWWNKIWFFLLFSFFFLT